jgi:hypothetical protein
MGTNRFECRTCPYEAALEKEWYDRTDLKQKEVDDVFGGAEEFANADSVASKYKVFLELFAIAVPLAMPEHQNRTLTRSCSSMPRRSLQWGTCVLLPAADSQCRRAHDYILEGMSSLRPKYMRRPFSDSS